MRGGLAVTLSAAMLLLAPSARAEPAVQAPPSPPQRALAVALVGGSIRAAVCPEGAASCVATEGAELRWPEAARVAAARADLELVRLASGRSVVIASVPTERGAFRVVLAAPAAGGDGVRVVWKGSTGRDPEGAASDETELEVSRSPRAARVRLRARRADLTACGRGDGVSVREVDPASLELLPVPAEDPLGAHRKGALALDARVVAGGADPPAARALSTLAASRPAGGALTDGDLATRWPEPSPVDPRFSSATFVAAEELPIVAIDVHLRPPAGSDRAVARAMTLATPDLLGHLHVDDAVPAAGLAVRVTLPKPISTSCLALVLGEPSRRGGAVADVVEVVARTALDAATPEQIARGLGGADGRARAAWLARAGDVGFEATVAAYGTLDPAGQDLARRVIDGRPCPVKAPFYAGQLRGRDEEARRRAIDRLARCGDDAVPALRAELATAKGDGRLALFDVLALAAPATAVEELALQLGSADDAERAALRSLLARAARRAKSGPALGRLFSREAWSALPEVARVDLLRAAAPRLASVPSGREAFGSMVGSGASFRTRYLLLPAAAELARAGEAPALALLEATLARDPDPRLRARAVRAAGRVPALAPAISSAASDVEPRVREATAVALAALGDEPSALASAAGPANRALSTLLSDRWTFVREAAATSAARLPRERAADLALAGVATGDPLPRVRRLAMRALGARGAVEHAAAVRARAASAGEDPGVRAEAHRALGAFCDEASLDVWTELVQRAVFPVGEADRLLGAAAIDAIAMVRPADAGERLAPARAPEAPREVREHVARALARPASCRR